MSFDRSSGELRVLIVFVSLTAIAQFSVQSAVIREDFASDPLNRGWNIRGDSRLFSWDAQAQRLDVTWDSARTNSFFLRELGTTLARSDTFRFGFTLQLEEIHTLSPETTFELALGLIRREDAFSDHFFRGAGVNAAWGVRSLVEFDYFPASRNIAPTLSAVLVSTNNSRWAMVNLFPFEILPGDRMRMEIEWHAPDQELALRVMRNGEPYASGTTVAGPDFSDLRPDAFSVTSYSGDHQPAGYGGDIFARGWIDDIEIEYPDPPAVRITFALDDDAAHIAVPAVEGWTPELQQSADLLVWHPVKGDPLLTADLWVWTIPSLASSASMYRVALERP